MQPSRSCAHKYAGSTLPGAFGSPALVASVKGDRVKLTGYFEVRTYEKHGQIKRVRQFVVKTADLERAKIRDEEAA